MERNTVNIDLEEYGELLIKAYKYDELVQKRSNTKGYTPDDVKFNKRFVVGEGYENVRIMSGFSVPMGNGCCFEFKDDCVYLVNPNGDKYRVLTENDKPVVNVIVKNEADLPAIKSYINNENAKNTPFDLQ